MENCKEMRNTKYRSVATSGHDGNQDDALRRNGVVKLFIMFYLLN